MGFINDEQCAVFACHSSQRIVKARLRMNDSDISHDGLGQNTGHISRLQRPLQSLHIIEFDYLGRDRRIYRRPDISATCLASSFM
jgi:hypothetical protein